MRERERERERMFKKSIIIILIWHLQELIDIICRYIKENTNMTQENEMHLARERERRDMG